jgi:hypothetical protein
MTYDAVQKPLVMHRGAQTSKHRPHSNREFGLLEAVVLSMNVGGNLDFNAGIRSVAENYHVMTALRLLLRARCMIGGTSRGIGRGHVERRRLGVELQHTKDTSSHTVLQRKMRDREQGAHHGRYARCDERDEDSDVEAQRYSTSNVRQRRI